MKKFAIYLPQYHEIEENNQWWGKGFTEWTNVRNAKPLFSNHNQPQHPKNMNYYNLMNKSSVKWQTELAKKYGIDGFVYYHYYFSGKLIMEKPAENFLKWKDIEHKFFFCWANHTWTKGKGAQKEILIEQTYGDKEDWKQHFNYLLPFFNDTRYEKKNNMPILMIYVNEFPNKKEMLAYFDCRCKEEGYGGIYIIETYTSDLKMKSIELYKKYLTKQSKMIYFREPSVATSIYYQKHPLVRILHKLMREKTIPFLKSKVAKIDGNELYDIMKKNFHKKYMFKEIEIASGIFFEWDNTPRHKNKGYIITSPIKKKFVDYMNMVHEDYIFINAWNEWAEGMMLEPTEEKECKYLEWVLEVK